MTVAKALPWIPHLKTKINRGFRIMLMSTDSSVAYMAF